VWPQEPVFRQALDRYFGEPDVRTLELLGETQSTAR
jgi:hypothetical protein